MAEPPFALNPIAAGVRRALATPSNVLGSLSRPVAAALLGTFFAAGALGLTGTAHAQERNGAPLPNATVAEMPIGGGVRPDATPGTTAEVSNFDPHRLREYGLYQLFWNTHGDPDLSGGGLNELSLAGAQKLHDYAKTHDLEGKADNQGITAGERNLIKALLEHPHYSAFFELDAKAKLLELFEIQPDAVHTRDVNRPTDAGTITLPNRVSNASAYDLNGVMINALAPRFTAEYEVRKVELEGSGTPEEKSTRVLGLFRDYAKALWSHGELPGTEQAGQQLLDALERTRSGLVLGAKNYNGAPWSAAQGLVLGVLDPNNFPTNFPEARSNAPTTYLAMNDGMAGAMKYMDEYRVALGMQPGAEAHERRSPIGYVIGEPNGHNKAGSLSEQTPFSSSGLNWGIALFPGDVEIRALKPKVGFEFPIDALDRFGYFLRLNPNAGERLGVVDQAGRPVRVEKVIERDETGKATAWSAKFYGQDGQELEPKQVMGVFLSSSGAIKGDRKATGSVDMWWWGFCDRNTAQKLYKAKYNIPELEREVIKVKVGDTVISIPRAEAQKLVDASIPDLVRGYTGVGFRFDDQPATIRLTSGRVIRSKLAADIFAPGPGLSRNGGDAVSLRSVAGQPLLGTIEIKTVSGTTVIDARNIASITRDDATGNVTVSTPNEWQKEVTGQLLSAVDWGKGRSENGKTTVVQDESFPISGELLVQGNHGPERIPMSQVAEISGETKNELRLSSYLTWVSKNQGMYATDGSTGVVVSNGMRWTNKLDVEETEDDARPRWAPKGELEGMDGRLVRQPGDKIMWVRGLYGSEGQEPTSEGFSGWIQLSKSGRILNEAFTKGAPDFGWSANGALDWTSRSTFNPYEVPGLRVAIMVNGFQKSDAEMEALARRLNLPSNWREYRTPQE